MTGGRRSVLDPARPERICWGCDKYCPADDLACGNGTIRTLHPKELFGDDWLEWSEGGADRGVIRAPRVPGRSDRS
jgi:hypothetical protein